MLPCSYFDVPRFGPSPAMNEPIWFFDKTLTVLAEALAVSVSSAALILARRTRNAASYPPLWGKPPAEPTTCPARYGRTAPGASCRDYGWFRPQVQVPSAASIRISAAARACRAGSGLAEMAAVVTAPSARIANCAASVAGAPIPAATSAR